MRCFFNFKFIITLSYQWLCLGEVAGRDTRIFKETFVFAKKKTPWIWSQFFFFRKKCVATKQHFKIITKKYANSNYVHNDYIWLGGMRHGCLLLFNIFASRRGAVVEAFYVDLQTHTTQAQRLSQNQQKICILYGDKNMIFCKSQLKWTLSSCRSNNQWQQ